MRKTFLLIAAGLLFLLAGVSALSALQAVFDPNPVTGAAGSNLTAAVHVREATDFRGYRLDLTYDPGLLTFNSASAGALFAGQNIGWWRVFNTVPGELAVECLIFGYGLYVTGPGHILNLNFTATEAGSSLLNITSFASYNPEGVLIPGCCGSVGYVLAGSDLVYARLQSWLQGPWQDSSMSTQLQPWLPLTSPYPEDPVTLAAMPENIVDWVLVELRATPEGAPLAYRSCLLGSNGILESAGLPLVVFPGLAAGDYYTVIRHRNHLALMSSYAVTYTATGNYHFCDLGRSTNIYGTEGYVQLADRFCGLIAGDADADGAVAPSDRNDHWRMQAGSNGYLSSDFDLNSQVTPSDLNQYWRVNAGKGTAVP